MFLFFAQIMLCISFVYAWDLWYAFNVKLHALSTYHTVYHVYRSHWFFARSRARFHEQYTIQDYNQFIPFILNTSFDLDTMDYTISISLWKINRISNCIQFIRLHIMWKCFQLFADRLHISIQARYNSKIA